MVQMEIRYLCNTKCFCAFVNRGKTRLDTVFCMYCMYEARKKNCNSFFFFKIDNIPWIKRKKIRILFRVKKINMFKVVVRFTLYDMEMNANFAY